MVDSTNKSKSKRYLSPSFKKGAIKPKEKEEFKINLILNGFQDDDGDSSPSKHKSQQTENKSPSKGNRKSQIICQTPNPLINHENNHIKKYSYFSKPGKGEDGFTKVNQDSYIALPNSFSKDDFNIMGVLDGHGVNGHLVSQYVVKYITSSLSRNKKINSLETEEEIYQQLKKNNYEIIKRCYVHAEQHLAKSEIDANFSGTTCVILFQLGTHLICSNVGDSRCLMVGDKDVQLSIDQKPNLNVEMKRIIQAGGEVAQYEEDGIKSGPFRVWKRNEMYPGIAMSRSIGDLMATTLGVIPEPEIIEMELNGSVKFIVIASDGVWEFLDNKAVKEIVMPYYNKRDPEGACAELIKISTNWWEKEDIVIDDITAIVLFMK